MSLQVVATGFRAFSRKSRASPPHYPRAKTPKSSGAERIGARGSRAFAGVPDVLGPPTTTLGDPPVLRSRAYRRQRQPRFCWSPWGGRSKVARCCWSTPSWHGPARRAS
jgi:hypothetical protein